MENTQMTSAEELAFLRKQNSIYPDKLFELRFVNGHWRNTSISEDDLDE